MGWEGLREVLPSAKSREKAIRAAGALKVPALGDKCRLRRARVSCASQEQLSIHHERRAPAAHTAAVGLTWRIRIPQRFQQAGAFGTSGLGSRACPDWVQSANSRICTYCPSLVHYSSELVCVCGFTTHDIRKSPNKYFPHQTEILRHVLEECFIPA